MLLSQNQDNIVRVANMNKCIVQKQDHADQFAKSSIEEITPSSSRVKEIAENIIETFPGLKINSCSLNHVHPRRNGDVVIEYRLEIKDSQTSRTYTESLWGCVYSNNKEGEKAYLKISKYKSNSLSVWNGAGFRGFVSFDPDVSFLLRSVDLDEKLPGLQFAMSENFMREKFSQIPGFEEIGKNIINFNVQVFHYNTPGKRCTLFYKLQCQTSTQETEEKLLIGKVYQRAHKVEFAFDVMSQLAENGFEIDAQDHIRIPQPIGYIKEKNILLMEYYPNEPLKNDLFSDDSRPCIIKAANVLSKLHAAPLKLERIFTTADEIKRVDLASSKAAMVFPELALNYKKTWEQIAMNSDRYTTSCCVPIHGSFNLEHVVQSTRDIALFDYDNMSMGDPAKDIGSFLAYLFRMDIVHSREYSRVTGYFSNFLQAYRPVNSENLESRVRFYYRTSLARMAYMSLRRPRLHKLSSRLIEEAEYPNFL